MNVTLGSDHGLEILKLKSAGWRDLLCGSTGRPHVTAKSGARQELSTVTRDTKRRVRGPESEVRHKNGAGHEQDSGKTVKSETQESEVRSPGGLPTSPVRYDDHGWHSHSWL